MNIRKLDGKKLYIVVIEEIYLCYNKYWIKQRIMNKRLFTSESVTQGHPGKMCDVISNAIWDALMENNSMS